MSRTAESDASLALTTPELFFEDLRIGMHSLSAGRTVTEADVVSFAGLSGDYNSLHVDAHLARGTVHGQRLAHGLLVLSILSGLATRTPMMQGLAGAIVGLGGLECRFRLPTFIGDTLRARLTVAELKPTSKESRGVVVLHRDGINHRDETVLESVWTLIVSRGGAQ